MSGVGEHDGLLVEAAVDLDNTDTSDLGVSFATTQCPPPKRRRLQNIDTRSPVLPVDADVMSEIQLEPILADSGVDVNENSENNKEPNGEVKNSVAVSFAVNPEKKDPLLIPEILSKILQNYDFKLKDLKTCRVVNSVWNEFVESKFVSKSTVKLRNDLEMSKLNTVLEKAPYFPFGHVVIACGGINWPSFAIFFSTYGYLLHTLTIESENTLTADGNPSINGPGIFAKVMHMLKTAPNLTTLNIGEIVTGPNNGFNSLPAENIRLDNFENLKQLKRLQMEVAVQESGMSFSTRLLYKATNLEELSLVWGTPVEQFQPQPAGGFQPVVGPIVVEPLGPFPLLLGFQPQHVEGFQPVGPVPVVQPAVAPLQPLGQLQPFMGQWGLIGQAHHDPLFRSGLNAKRLAQSVRSQKIKKLKLRGIPTSFLTELNHLPGLEEFQMENFTESTGLNILVFLTAHADHLKTLVLKNAAHFHRPKDLPLLPKLESLVYDVPGRGLPQVSVCSDMVPNLIKIKTTPRALARGFIKGFFDSVREIEIYDEGHAEQQQWLYICPMSSLTYRFTNLKALRFTEVRNELLTVFKFVQQLEELTVTCYQLNESKLTGMDFEDADRIYTRFLKDKYTAQDIQDAARPHLYSVKMSSYCLRDMKRLKKFRIAVDGWPGKTVMSDACIFLSFMLMKPMEVLAVDNIQLPVRGVLQMQECVQKVYRKFSDEPGFNSSD